MRYTRAHEQFLTVAAAAGIRPRDMQVTSPRAPLALDSALSRATFASEFSKQAWRKSVKVTRAQISAPIPDTPSTPLAQRVASHMVKPMAAMDSLLSPAASTKAGVLSDDDVAFQRERAMAEIARIQQRRERDRARGTGATPRRKPPPAAAAPSRAWTTDVETPVAGPGFESALSEAPPVPAYAPAPAHLRKQSPRARDENDFRSRMYPEAEDETERPPPTPEKPRGPYAQRRAPQSARKHAGKAGKVEQVALKPMRRELSNLTNGDTTDGGPDAREAWSRAQRTHW
jgi:hypothetical protein